MGKVRWTKISERFNLMSGCLKFLERYSGEKVDCIMIYPVKEHWIIEIQIREI